MKNLFLIILLSITLLSVEKPQSILDSISQHAIRIGDGKTSNMYVFIDPLCRHSKKYIKDITLDEELQKKNSYYIFLYRLPKFESEKLIQYIYQSEDPKEGLEDIIVYEDEIDLDEFQVSKKTLKIINQVAFIGKVFKIDRRPYVIKLPSPITP